MDKTVQREYLVTYDRLADAVTPSLGFDGALVRKVSTDAIRDELKRRGWLQLDEKDHMTAITRNALSRAKTHWLRGVLVEDDGMIWRK